MKINKKILASSLGLSLIFCLGASSFAATGTVNTETVRLRESASTESNIIDSIDMNSTVDIIGEDGEWYQVKNGEYTGYIFKEYLDVSGEIEKPEEKVEETKVEEAPKEDNKTNVEEKKNEKDYTIGNKLNSKSSVYLLPSFGSSKITSVDVNTEVEIVKTMNKWSNVKVNGKLGWIPNQKLYVVDNTVIEEQEEEKPEEKENEENNRNEINDKGYVNTESANLRSGPGTSYSSIAGLVQYELLLVISEQDDWYEVRTTDDMNGYVSKSLVTLGNPPVTARSAADRRSNVVAEEEPVAEESYSYAAPSGNAGSVVATAQQYLGYSYVYGGSSPSTGFDCSGFTSYVYSACGMSISRTSYSQANDGVAVDDLQPGDLLLFNNGGGGSIGHVGIYVGDGQFIHASNPTGGVKYDTINSGYYANYYAGARRIY